MNINYENIFIYYSKIENKLFVELRGMESDFTISVFKDDELICFNKDFHIKNDVWFYRPTTIFSHKDNIKVEVRDKDILIKEEYLTLRDESLVEPDNENIKYVSGALLGDFIYQLSIIKEMYLKTGKRGDLYMIIITNECGNTKVFEFWKLGVKRAYNDLKEIILSQDYISSFQIYKGEKFENYIDLGSWRNSELLKKSNIYEIFKKEYGVEWGSHKWLDLPKSSVYNDYILVSNTMRKQNNFFDYNSLKTYNKKIFFATTDIKEYNLFMESGKYKFDLLLFDELIDFWIAINNCYLFVSSFGSFFAAANALHKNTIVLLPDREKFSDDVIHFYKDIPNLKWYENEDKNNIK